MSVRVEVPEGCIGLDFPDGSKSDAKDRAGMVEISDRQASMLRAMGKTDLKIIGSRFDTGRKGPWVDCATCPKSFLRSSADPDQTRCQRCRGN